MMVSQEGISDFFQGGSCPRAVLGTRALGVYVFPVLHCRL